MRWSKTSSCLQYAVDDKAANNAYDAARHVKLWPGGHLPLQEASMPSEEWLTCAASWRCILIGLLDLTSIVLSHSPESSKGLWHVHLEEKARQSFRAIRRPGLAQCRLKVRTVKPPAHLAISR